MLCQPGERGRGVRNVVNKGSLMVLKVIYWSYYIILTLVKQSAPTIDIFLPKLVRLLQLSVLASNLYTSLEFHISQSNGEGAVLEASGMPPREENWVEFFGAQISISVLVQQGVHHL